MKIEIQHIPSQGEELSFHKQAKEFSVLKDMLDTGECGPFAPIDIRMEVKAEGDTISVNGVLTTAVELICSRCAEAFSHPIDQRYDLRFSRDIPDDLHSSDDDEEVELTAERIGLIYFKGETIDLKEVIQEQVVIALPYKPLCRATCRGLCPHCGTNLNSGACRCGNGAAASPFSILKNIKLPQG